MAEEEVGAPQVKVARPLEQADAGQPAAKKPKASPGEKTPEQVAAADEFYQEVVLKYIPKDFAEHHYIGGERIYWEKWAEFYADTLAMRRARGAKDVPPHAEYDYKAVGLVALFECFAFALTRTYIGNFEIQIVMHLLILECHRKGPTRVMPKIQAVFEEIEHAMELAKGQYKWWSEDAVSKYERVYKEGLRRFKTHHTPMIGYSPVYHSGAHVFGLAEPPMNYF